MSISSKALLIILALLAVSTLARSDGIYNPAGGQVGFLDGINNLGAGTGGVTPPTGNNALLVDNTNPALLVDNTNPACLVGGC